MRHAFLTLVLPCLATPLAAQFTEPYPDDRKVLVIGIDGLMPSALEATATPNLDRLAAQGVFVDHGVAELPTLAAPNWASALTGVAPAKHGVVDDTWAGANLAQFPAVFQRIHTQAPELRTEIVSSWWPLVDELGRGADLELRTRSDVASTAAAVQRLTFGQPDLLFLFLGDVDDTGHAFGFGAPSPAYLTAVTQADARVGQVLRALEARLASLPGSVPPEDWLVIVTTGHGGTGTGHGGSSAAETTIFVTLAGGEVPPGGALPAFGPADVAPTVLDHLRVPLFGGWGLDGTPLVQHFQCAEDLVAIPRHVAGSVELSWHAATGSQVSGSILNRNGLPIAFVPPGLDAWVDTPDLTGLTGHALFEYELTPILSSPGAPCPSLRAKALLSTGDVFFEDDFDSYADDAAFLAAGWSTSDTAPVIENSTWTVQTQPVCPGYILPHLTNPATFDGTPSRGGFAISDSCKGGLPIPNPLSSGASHDLISPRFDASVQIATWLHVDVSAVLNNGGHALFMIDASRDDGQSWTNVFTRVSPGRLVPPLPTNDNADGYYGRLSVDLSPVVAGWDECRVRFRHWEPTWDWWVAIDNVVIDNQDTTQGGPTSLLATETFTGSFPPPGWSIVGQNTGTETWHNTNKGGKFVPGAVSGGGINRIGHPGPSPDFALLDSDADPDPSEDEYLITPALDCSGASRVFLHFKSEERRFTQSQHEAVLVSLDGGLTFLEEPVFTYDGEAIHVKNDPPYWAYAEDPYYAERVLEVPAAAGQPDVAFAFHFASDGDEWWWAIDDVAVTAAP